MVDFVYGEGMISFPKIDASAAALIFLIELYRVADKYVGNLGEYLKRNR